MVCGRMTVDDERLGEVVGDIEEQNRVRRTGNAYLGKWIVFLLLGMILIPVGLYLAGTVPPVLVAVSWLLVPVAIVAGVVAFVWFSRQRIDVKQRDRTEEFRETPYMKK